MIGRSVVGDEFVSAPSHGNPGPWVRSRPASVHAIAILVSERLNRGHFGHRTHPSLANIEDMNDNVLLNNTVAFVQKAKIPHD